jgi:hypothetical protein
MIIWSGWGWLVPVLAFVVSLVFEAVTEASTGKDQFYQNQPWLLAVAMVVAGTAVWFLSAYFDKKQGRVVIDKATGKELVLRSSHSFFFIPMRFWAFLLPLFGVAYVVLK